jgi:HEPN domain-containing protein
MVESDDYGSIFPSPKAIELAKSFSLVALEDAIGAKQMFRKKLYSLAVYHLQQSVEKSTKATGLLSGFLHPTVSDLRAVSHKSVLAVLLRMPAKVEKAKAMFSESGLSAAYDEYGRLGLLQLLPDTKLIKIPETATIRGWIVGINELPVAEMWRRTLELKLKDSLTKGIMETLREASELAKAADYNDKHTFKTITLLGDPGFILYHNSLYGRCFNRAIALSFLTMWHEATTRYPPGGGLRLLAARCVQHR